MINFIIQLFLCFFGGGGGGGGGSDPWKPSPSVTIPGSECLEMFATCMYVNVTYHDHCLHPCPGPLTVCCKQALLLG